MSKPEIDFTCRGFEIVSFKDTYGKVCSLQQSSVTDDENFDSPGAYAVWLGRGDERAHLTREHVEWLVEYLQNWLNTGSFNGINVSENQIRILEHTMGGKDPEKWYRNHFVANPGHNELPDLRELEKKGLMLEVEAPSFAAEGDMLFIVTEKGRDFLKDRHNS